MMNKKNFNGRTLYAMILTLGMILFPCLSVAESVGSQKTLYERLGGYDAISSVVDVFLIKVWEDPLVGRYFIGMGTDTRNQLRQKNKNLMCANTGGAVQKNQSASQARSCRLENHRR